MLVFTTHNNIVPALQQCYLVAETFDESMREVFVIHDTVKNSGSINVEYLFQPLVRHACLSSTDPRINSLPPKKITYAPPPPSMV